MKYSIRFEEESLNDFFDGLSYYEKSSQNVADRFYQEFWQTINRIKNNPFHFQKKYRSVMIAFTEVFPFGIHYIVENDIITVIRILHTKRFFK
jgi:hypothetical protein